MRLFLAILCFVLLSAARAPRYDATWISLMETASSEPTEFPKGQHIKIGRVVPVRLFKLLDDASVPSGPISYLSKDTLIVPADNELKKFCRFERHMGSAFGCLRDADGDGRFESYYGAQVFKEFFVGTVGDEGGSEALNSPISYKEVNPSVDAPEIDLEFVYLGKKNDNKILFRFCFSKKIYDGRTFYQSRHRKGYSVICSTDILSDPAMAETHFGVNIVANHVDDKMLKALISPSNAAFKTSSNFR